MTRKIAIVGLFVVVGIWGAWQYSSSGHSLAQATPTTTVVVEPPEPVPHPCDTSDIATGNRPPRAGYGTFAYCGGSHLGLFFATHCADTAEAAIWHNKADGEFVVWLPGAIEIASADFFAEFPEGEVIPEGTIFIARCSE